MPHRLWGPVSRRRSSALHHHVAARGAQKEGPLLGTACGKGDGDKVPSGEGTGPPRCGGRQAAAEGRTYG
ncbi:hypothetical protein KSZ_58700 [Dictyobacter formicarum]|uniref:Uncharacterized protein n=1 Tax=Dictyobacter formicarum TaxID=2778368 RepID=A0ABQ3VQA4_9CHLR|nr:hypothetical protein KSZ_58700 [Dictyobacter formicarum]